MKAVQVTGPGVVEVVTVESPVPGEGEVLVRVEASTVNPGDAMVAAGGLHGTYITDGQLVGLGFDVIGPVEALGAGVTGFAVGDRVAGVRDDVTGALRGMAEYALVRETDLAAVPDSLSYRAAASIGMNALTAAQGVALCGDAGARSLLVTGAAGSVGGLGLELARDLGWATTGLARESDRAFVESTGAKLVTHLEGTYDAVFDAAMFGEALAGHVVESGHVVGVDGVRPAPAISGASAEQVTVHSDGPGLADLLARAAEGRLNVRHAGDFTLDEVDDALAAARRSGTRGRWVVVPGSTS